MREMGTGEFIVAALAGFLGGFTLLFFTDFALVHAQWCITDDEHCLRDWISALSGWAAATAAAVTVVFLAGQMQEARRQTDYITGIAHPTISITDPPIMRDASEAFQNFLEITNWNRYPIVVHRVHVHDEHGHVLLEERVADDQAETVFTRNLLQAQLEQGRLFMDGWTDRTSAPPSVGILIAVGKVGRPTDDYAIREHVSFGVDLTILDANARRIRIDVATPHAIVL